MTTRTWIGALLGASFLALAGCAAGGDAAPSPSEEGAPVELAKEQPPPPVERLAARWVANGVRLRWRVSPDVRYRVLRRDAQGVVRRLVRLRSDLAGARTYVDRTARRSAVYRYRVVPENLWGVRGRASPWVRPRASAG